MIQLTAVALNLISISVPLPLLVVSFHPVGLRCDAPVEDVVKIRGVEDAQRALALQPSGTGVPTHTPHPTLVEQFSSEVSTTHTDPGPGPSICPPPIRDQSYHGPQALLKGEGRVGHSATLCRRQLFVLLLFCCCWTIRPRSLPDRRIGPTKRKGGSVEAPTPTNRASPLEEYPNSEEQKGVRSREGLARIR